MARKLLAIICILLVASLLLISCGESVSVVGASINEKGELILEMSDGSTKNLGVVKGEQGEKGDKGDKGDTGEKGEDGYLPEMLPNVEATNGLVYYLLTDGTYGVSADKNTNYIDHIVIPSTFRDKPVTVIIDEGFKDFVNIKSVQLPNTLKEIRKSAFQGCTNIESITIPSTVTSIGSYAFSGCKRLTSVTIPDSVTSIGNNAFAGCTGLTSIKYRGTEEQWNAISNGSYWIDHYNYTITYNYTGE